MEERLIAVWQVVLNASLMCPGVGFNIDCCLQSSKQGDVVVFGYKLLSAVAAALAEGVHPYLSLQFRGCPNRIGLGLVLFRITECQRAARGEMFCSVERLFLWGCFERTST